MKGKIKLISVLLVIALIFNVLAITLNVYAIATTNTLTITFRNNYNSEQGKVQYSLNDGATWVDVTQNIVNQPINVSGDYLRIKIIANDGYRVDPSGIVFNSQSLKDGTNGICGGMTNNANGYQVDPNSQEAVLEDVEFAADDQDPGQGGNNGSVPIDGGTLVTGNFTYTNSGDGDPVDIWLNQTEIGVGQPPEEQCDYYYVDGEDVQFDLATFIDNRITSVTINGVSYNNQIPKNDSEWLDANLGQIYMISIRVPYAETYNIVTSTTKDFVSPIGNFLWSSDEEDIGSDDYIGHGSLELLTIEYEGQVYTKDEMLSFNVPYADWEEENGSGSAVLPKGAIITVSLIPESGYQLTSFTINGGEFEPGEDVGVYSFEIRGGNFHLGAHFTAVDDEVDSSSSDAVTDGTITLTGQEDSMEIGTAKLEVKDIELTQEQISNFETVAGDYRIANFLDISLFNTVYKGSENDSWDTQVDELDNSAVITLKLAENVNGKDVVIVHEKHDGTYEVIDTTYDETTNTITFKTKSFSNYAIATKENTEVSETQTTKSSNPKTGDNIMKTISIFAIATLGVITTHKIRRNRK